MARPMSAPMAEDDGNLLPTEAVETEPDYEEDNADPLTAAIRNGDIGQNLLHQSNDGWDGSLTPAHRKMLEEGSAIILSKIDPQRYTSITRGETLERAGFIQQQCYTAPGLLIRRWDANGIERSPQFRPDNPRLDDDGEPLKYEFPPGSVNILDVPPTVRDKVMDGVTPLWITEGPKQTDAGASRELAIVGLSGVWNFRWQMPIKNGGTRSVVISDFAYIPLQGRIVMIVYDSDARTNKGVRRARFALTKHLLGHGAKVKWVNLPPGKKGTKAGLDDFFAAGGTVKELEGLIENPNLADEGKITTAELALEITCSDHFARDPNGKLYVYTNGVYVPREEEGTD